MALAGYDEIEFLKILNPSPALKADSLPSEPSENLKILKLLTMETFKHTQK